MSGQLDRRISECPDSPDRRIAGSPASLIAGSADRPIDRLTARS
jgi:hypothetical protein